MAKVDRSHKSKLEQKRLNKQRKVKVIGDGRFVQRAKRPAKQGKAVKSQILRVDANFADWVRKRAETEGSVTEVTRKLYQRIIEAEGAALSSAIHVNPVGNGEVVTS